MFFFDCNLLCVDGFVDAHCLWRRKTDENETLRSLRSEKLKLRTQVMAEEPSCAPSETVSVCFSGSLLSNSKHCCVTTTEYKWSSALLDRQHYLKDTFRDGSLLLELRTVHDPLANSSEISKRRLLCICRLISLLFLLSHKCLINMNSRENNLVTAKRKQFLFKHASHI